MEGPPLLGLPPKRNQAPEDPFTTRQLLDDDLESSTFQHRHKFVIDYVYEEFFPSAMTVSALPFGRGLYPLYRVAQL